MPSGSLVVDNHPVILKFMRGLLEKRGYDVATASDGLAALEVLKTFTPDVVFLDLVMPNIGGEKLCRMMRRTPACSNAFIVILSAIAAENHPDHTAFGADACIAKGPFNIMTAHVCEMLERFEKTGRPPPDREILGLEGLQERAIIKELLSVKRHFEMVLNHLSEGILELTADERIVYANPAAASMLGIHEEDLLGTSLSRHFGGSQREKLRSLLQRRGAGPEFVSRDSPMVVDGKFIVPDVARVQDENGPSSILILKDVTGQRLAEAKLYEAQKMEAIATLAGGIAHQFNNALAVIMGNMEFMKMTYAEKEELSRYLEPMLDAVHRMAKLNDHLLAYARGGKYQPRVVRVVDFIRESLPLIHLTPSGHAARLETDLQDCDISVTIDTSQMQMVLSAILANAAEAVEDGGKIRLVCTGVEIAPEGIPTPLSAGLYACIAVEDTGKGMDEETRKRVFEPFFTTKFQGRGMGMSAVYGIVRNHGGWIGVDSALGGGTTVRVFLPATKPEPAKADKSAAESARERKTLLLVDDEPMVLDVNRVLLEKLGYRVLVAGTGKEAIAIAASQQNHIDLAILDIVLNDIKPHELYASLMASRPDLKVIVCSGYSVHGPAQEILDQGAQGFIQKPFSLAGLSAKLKEVLGTSDQ